jgi:hypothetical protein
MIFHKWGYPKPNGAFDWEDSSHLAGILAVTEHDQAVNCTKYWTKYYIRCLNSKYDFSRDQAIMLMAGLYKQGYKDYIKIRYIKGKDYLPPSVQGVENIAITGKATFIQKLWKWSIYRYWSQLDGAWRNEPELAEHIIKYVERKL